MTLTHVLIDYENVPLSSLPALNTDTTRVYVFLGPNNKKLSTDFVQVLQPFGIRAEYVGIAKSGKNSLDFHLAFYLGKLAALYPGDRFRIISKDQGFDTLIEHLVGKDIDAKRQPAIDLVVPAVKAASAKAPKSKASGGRAEPVVAPPARTQSARKSPAKVAPVVKAAAPQEPPPQKSQGYSNKPVKELAELAWQRLGHRKNAKPATLKKLLGTLAADFRLELSEEKLGSVVKRLEKEGHLQIDGARIVYH